MIVVDGRCLMMSLGSDLWRFLLPCAAASLLLGAGQERFSLDGEEVPFEPIQLWPSPGAQVLGPEPAEPWLESASKGKANKANNKATTPLEVQLAST